jgi:putrescine transport system ATP-binding protein
MTLAAPERPPLVRFEGLVKRFDGQAAVDGVELEIREGEFFALLGPSGCGKSTLLRLLAGLETPDAGRILLDGRDLAGLPPHARPLHLMFQSYALFPHLDVARNIAFGLAPQRLGRAETIARVAEMLQLLRLEGLERRKPDQLSGGQKQRVALARALAPRPRILLLDEPLAAIDRKLREATQLELKALQQRLGLTFVIVTHDQDEAMVTADRLAVMREGRIAQLGAPAELYERPQDRFVADFLGAVNLFEARVQSVEGSLLRLAGPEGVFVAHGPPAAPGESLWLAVRPEKMVLHREAPPGPNRLQGRLAEIAYLGDRSIHVVELASGLRVRAARINAGPDPAHPGSGPPLAPGAVVWLGFAPDAGVALAR